MMEAEIRVMYPQGKEYLDPPEAGRGKEGCSARILFLQKEHDLADTL